MNADNVLRLREYIAQEHIKFNPCVVLGESKCVAGHAADLFGIKKEDSETKYCFFARVKFEMRGLLDISDYQIKNLFLDNRPFSHIRHYSKEDALNVLDGLVRTSKVRWRKLTWII